MEQQLNEIARFQKLAGIITEAPAGVNVIKNPIIRKQAPAAPAPKQTTATSTPKNTLQQLLLLNKIQQLLRLNKIQ